MIHIKFQLAGFRSTGSREKTFKGMFTVYWLGGHVCHVACVV